MWWIGWGLMLLCCLDVLMCYQYIKTKDARKEKIAPQVVTIYLGFIPILLAVANVLLTRAA